MKPFNIPNYSKSQLMREKATKVVKPEKVIILEGHLIMVQEELRELMDMKIFIDTDDDIRLCRRVWKAQKQFGGDINKLKEMLYKYEH
mmetsp:Transcript_3200/g.3109  ORF Transcript_3200/g.3109 Transcript_3200/m.3109 type:complete len:88 (+) Transcript_3200:112-375(+)